MRLSRLHPAATASRGFTLVELMVVIAIIAILAAVILPVYGRAREQARQTTCMSNLHQLAVALKIYRMDYGAYPPVLGADYEQNASLGLRALVAGNYLESVKVLRCPDDNTDLNQFNQALADYNRTNNQNLAEWTQPQFDSYYSSYQAEYNRYGYGPPDTPYHGSSWYDMNDDLQCNQTDAAALYGPLQDQMGRPLWDTSGTPPGAPAPYFPGLINPNAPDTTIITHSKYHRSYYREGGEFDMVVRLGGETERKSRGWAARRAPNSPDPEAGWGWVLQPGD